MISLPRTQESFPRGSWRLVKGRLSSHEPTWPSHRTNGLPRTTWPSHRTNSLPRTTWPSSLPPPRLFFLFFLGVTALKIPGATPLPATVDASWPLLRSFFEAAYKPSSQWKIGFEYEVGALLLSDLSPLPFRGSPSIEQIFDRFRQDYRPTDESWEEDFCFGMTLPHGNLSLEPGGQIEFSSHPVARIAETYHQLQRFLTDLQTYGEPLGLGFYIAGVNPFHPLDAVPWSFKKRYKVMREYLIRRGRYAHHMMKQTMSIQYNIDYASEADAFRKFRAANQLQPLFQFLLTHSSIYEGKLLDAPFRPAIWKEMDPDRCGVLSHISSFDQYVAYALDVPIFFLKRGDAQIPVADGTTFRQFLTSGFQGLTATYDDWTLHLTTLFPETRFKKNALELRMFDGNPPAYVPALAALVKALFYDDTALDAVLARAWTPSWEEGETLLSLASQHLSPEEAPFLEPLHSLIRTRQRPSDSAQALIRQKPGDLRSLFETLRISPAGL